ncbi:MAG: alpha/beta hydrolase [Lachnospiraceae bacterium]|nr:alpha/beta hydrolase [Lachnospiraceae bacterium]
MKDKIAVIFPGIGYHTDKPLLYYSKKQAAGAGYRVIEVSYGNFKSGIKGNADLMKEAFESALTQTETILQNQEFDSDGELLFISKSIGTVVAAAYEKEHKLNAKNIYFTPLEDTFGFVKPESGIVFHGTADPWAETSVIKSACEKLSLPLFITEDANHSLEQGVVSRDVEALALIMDQCESYLLEKERI